MNDGLIEEMVKMGWLIPLRDIDLRKNYGSFLKIGVVSKTLGFFINRNNEATEVTSEEFYGENRVVVPASKWRGAERSFILSILRKSGQIHEDYARNMVKKKEYLQNPASLLWGDSSTGKNEEAAGIASRSFYDWAYSYEPLGDITLNLQHNSIGDDGSIIKDGGKVVPNALYNVNYVKPGVQFIRYVTLENVSPEMLLLQLIALQGTTRYGARTSMLGDNMRNEIIAIAGSKGERPLSSYSTMGEIWKSDSYDPREGVLAAMQNNYPHVIHGEKLDSLLSHAAQLMNSVEDLKATFDPLTRKMSDQWKDFFERK